MRFKGIFLSIEFSLRGLYFVYFYLFGILKEVEFWEIENRLMVIRGFGKGKFCFGEV